MRVLLSLIWLSLCMHSAAQDLHINEMMSGNGMTISDEDGEYSDWIELYNSSDSPVDLSGWYLSDDADNPLKWRIAEGIMEAGAYRLIYASSKDRPGPGELHSNFKIALDGEIVLLSNPDGDLVDYVPPVPLSVDISHGSLVDGQSGERVFFGQSSPGATNADGTVIAYATDELTFSRSGGFYDEGFALEINSTEGAEIRYTRDGSEPDNEATVLSSALTIEDRVGEANGISMIDTGVLWEQPGDEVEKATVIKAASFVNGIRVSPIYTETYFISARIAERYDDLPVISISVDDDSLFSFERGIYVEGRHYDPSFDTGSGNYYKTGRDWEREVHVEYFDDDHEKQFAQNAGARIHGNSSRHHSQKTLRLYSRGEYGEPYFNYPFFEHKDIAQFKRILLRSSSTDFGNTMFKDILCATLVDEMDVDYMAAQVCIVFINGEYWGVHSIRERIDKYFLSQNHAVDPDSVDLLALNEEVEEGDALSYNQLKDYVRNHDLTDDEVYEQVAEQLDISNFIDYNIAQLYFANFDWPATNIRYWKPRPEGNKWRWIFYDCDRCLLLSEHDQLFNYVQENNQYNFSPEWTILLFNRLLRNEQFKEAFVQRFFYLLNTAFRGDRMLEELNAVEEMYRPLVAEHIARWHYPSSVNEWNESISELRGFMLKRPAIMVQQLVEYLGEQYTLYPNPIESGRDFVSLDMEYTDDVDTRIEVYTSTGELVYDMKLGPTEDAIHPRIPISDLGSGLYVVRINYGNLLFTEKLMID